MKHLKLLILGCGAALLVIMITNGLNFEDNKIDTIIMLAAYGLPALMGAMALAKPPMQSWQAAIALSGFGVAAVRTRIWEQLPDLMDKTGKGKAVLALQVVGVLVSALAMMKPEDK
ncbi:MAG: hypothetical protein ABI867_36955 [Kofleriaceae bacterium]